MIMSGKQLIRKYTENQLRDLLTKYDQQKLTNTEIGDKFGVNRSTISRWRRQLGLQKDKPMPISDEELVKKYNAEHSNIADLAKELGVSKDSVRLHLIKGGVKNPRKSDPKKVQKNVLKYHYSEDELKKILVSYSEQGLSKVEMARRLDSNRRTIGRWFKKFGLNKPQASDKVTDEQLCTEYLKGHSANYLAKKYDVSPDFVIRHLKSQGVFKGKTHGMKIARHRMHDDLWSHIKADLDNGALKNEIIDKYHISAPSLNSLLSRKRYLLGINHDVFEQLQDIDQIIDDKNYSSILTRMHARELLTAIRRFATKYNFLPTKANLGSFSDLQDSVISRWANECDLNDFFQADTHRSYLVLKIMALLQKNHIDYELNNRKLIAPLEIDIWVPKYNLGFEVNPTSTHLTTSLRGFRRQVASSYHQNKSLKCFERGIRLVHVYDWKSITEGQILDYLQFPHFDFVNKTVDLDRLLITKGELHKLGYYVHAVSQPVKHYARPDTGNECKSGEQNKASVAVYDAGKLILSKYQN